METEQQMIDRISTNDARYLRYLLNRVERTGKVAKSALDMLLTNDLISFGGPREGINRYNCYRLTERGRAELAR